MGRLAIAGLMVALAACTQRASQESVDRAPAPVATPAPPPPPALKKLTVLFLDEPRFVEGTDPYEAKVERLVPADVDEAETIVRLYFEGPTDEEKARGLRTLTHGLTGARVERDGETVHVHTLGTCATNGAAYNVATLLTRNLKQVEGVRHVKIYDPQGRTQEPSTAGDSIPECMEP